MSNWSYLVGVTTDEFEIVKQDFEHFDWLWDEKHLFHKVDMLFLYQYIDTLILLVSAEHRKYHWGDRLDYDKRNFEAEVIIGKHPIESLSAYYLFTPCYSLPDEVIVSNKYLQSVTWDSVQNAYLHELCDTYGKYTSQAELDAYTEPRMEDVRKMFESVKTFYNKIASENKVMIHACNAKR